METKKLINKDAFDILYEEATKDSADYIKKYISEVIITDGGWWNVALSKIEVDGLDYVALALPPWQTGRGTHMRKSGAGSLKFEQPGNLGMFAMEQD